MRRLLLLLPSGQVGLYHDPVPEGSVLVREEQKVEFLLEKREEDT